MIILVCHMLCNSYSTNRNMFLLANHIFQYFLHILTPKQTILVKHCQWNIHHFAFKPYRNPTLLPFFSYEMIRNFSGISISIKVFLIKFVELPK